MKYDHPGGDPSHLIIAAAEFKATCLDIFSRLADRRVARVTVTRRGKPVAELYPPDVDRDGANRLFGCLRGSVVLPEGIDLTDPVIDMTSWSPTLPI